MQARGSRRALAYFVGRLSSYVLLGSLAGAFGHALLQLSSLRWVEAATSWSVALILGWSALRLVRTPSAARPLQLGKKRKVSFVNRAFARLADEPFLLGAFTALLPCGALAAALLLAASLGHAVSGALAMFSFAFITGLGLAGVSVMADKLTLGRLGQRLVAGALVAGALILVWRPFATSTSETASCPLHAGSH